MGGRGKEEERREKAWKEGRRERGGGSERKRVLTSIQSECKSLEVSRISSLLIRILNFFMNIYTSFHCTFHRLQRTKSPLCLPKMSEPISREHTLICHIFILPPLMAAGEIDIGRVRVALEAFINGNFDS